MKNQNDLLQVNNLSIHFDTLNGQVKAVDGISFKLKKGETLGIVGESGSGKSITSKAIIGLLPVAAKIGNGEVFFQNKNEKIVELLSAKEKEMQQWRGNEIAMIFQDPMTSLNPVFRCGHQVDEAVLLHQKLTKNEAEQKTLSWFEKVQLNDPERIYQSYPHQLSGGQRQRVMIAMAMIANPSLLIADEPTSALDVTVQLSILKLIKDLKKEWGGGIVFISHDLAVVAEVADSVLVMQHGKIVEQGKVVEVFNNPKERYTQRLLLDFKGKKEEGNKIDRVKPPVLKIKNLSTHFASKTNFFGKIIQKVKAVDEVSFEVFEGETVGLVGESGSGKTTLGRSVLHLQKPTGGEVFYNGESLSQVDDKNWKNYRRELQIIFQDPYSSLNPRQMIGPAIMEPMMVHGIYKNNEERKAAAFELLKKVGLEEDHFWRFPKEFSGGQRQRVCIARALAVQPKFIVCDECVSALDVTVQAAILDLLKQLQKEHDLTYLFISHDLSVIRQISDRVAVMQKGKIVEMDFTETIFSEPKKEYTKELLSAIPKGLLH